MYHGCCGTKDRVLDIIRAQKSISGSEIAKQLGLSRQAVNRHIHAQMEQGLIYKAGSTREAEFRTGTGDRARKESLQPNARRIVGYAFTEMLNNTIEHSQSQECDINLETGPRGHLRFREEALSRDRSCFFHQPALAP